MVDVIPFITTIVVLGFSWLAYRYAREAWPRVGTDMGGFQGLFALFVLMFLIPFLILGAVIDAIRLIVLLGIRDQKASAAPDAAPPPVTPSPVASLESEVKEVKEVEETTVGDEVQWEVPR